MRLRLLMGVSLLLGACGGEAPAPVPPPVSTPPVAATAPTPAVAPSVPAQVCGTPRAREVELNEMTFGVAVSDPYRWMEGNDNAELTTWLRAQGECAAKVLTALPGRDALFTRVRELGLGTSSQTAMRVAGGRAFFTEVGVGQQLPSLVVREQNGEQRVLVDPTKLGQGGQHASVNAFAPSPDGKRIAYDLALGGGEVSNIHVMDVARGADLPDVIERVWGELAAEWTPDGKGFFYTQMAPPNPDADPVQNMQARYHVLGQPVTRDVAFLGKGTPSTFPSAPEDLPTITVPADAREALAAMSGAHSEQRIAVAPLSKLDRTGGGRTPWRKVAAYEDQVDGATLHGDRLYITTFHGAPNRKLVSVPVSDPDLSKAKVEFAESPDATINEVAGARDGLYVKTMSSGHAHLWRLPWTGGVPVAVALPFEGWISELATDPLRDGARFNLVGWTRRAAFYDVDAKGTVKATGIAAQSSADFTSIVVEEVEARSGDGTAVPLSILRPKDLAMDGSRPAILYGYGGYNISQTPSFNPTRLAFLEQGATYAVCHVRGGGDKGETWHQGGSHEHKMNGIHDFEACAQYLIDHKLTSASHLAASGRSGGGILVGRAITDRPDLFASANIAVGLVNTTRLVAAENGANQRMELGDWSTEAGFKALAEMDAYAHVTPGTAYPAVLFTVGLNDRRVAPWMSAKMAARLQTASTSGRPILVRTDADAGHGVGSSRDQTYAELADVYSFMLAAAKAEE